MSLDLTLEQVLTAIKGKCLRGHAGKIAGYGTDTRVSLSNKIFFALKGEKFDGHDFLEAAVHAKAAAVVVHDTAAIDKLLKTNSAQTSLAIIQVSDSLKALQDLANYWRKRNKFNVIGITGSNGKTTTKEFTSQLLQSHYKTHASVGSFNNHWGVPFTLLDAPADTEVVVSEMGMNHPGELTELTGIAEPNIVMCTTVGRAHLGHFSNVEEIARAKQEIYLSTPSALALFNIDNPHTKAMYAQALNTLSSQKENIKKLQTIIDESKHQKKPIYTFSNEQPSADVFFKAAESTIEGLKITGHILGLEGEALVPVFGVHNQINLAAAALVAAVVGVNPQAIWEDLSQCHTVWGRNQWLRGFNGERILFDGYNANPESSGALLENLKSIKKDGVWTLLLGEMLEMGDKAEAVHFELGQKTAMLKCDNVLFVGHSAQAFKRGFESAIKSHPTILKTFLESSPEVTNQIKQIVSTPSPTPHVIAVKGSRGVGLEKLIEFLVPGGLKKN